MKELLVHPYLMRGWAGAQEMVESRRPGSLLVRIEYVHDECFRLCYLPGLDNADTDGMTIRQAQESG